MSLIEVAVSGGLLALFLYGIINFSTFAARMNQSNKKSGDFSTIMSTVTNMIKTPQCDALLSGLSFDDSAAQVGVSQSFSGLNPVAGFTLASPSPAPGFALTNTAAGEPPSFQLILIKPAVDSIAGTQLVQDTVDLRISLKKVDSSGRTLPGASLESKDFTLKPSTVRRKYVHIKKSRSLCRTRSESHVCYARSAGHGDLESGVGKYADSGK
jgi:hypothetical protein